MKLLHIQALIIWFSAFISSFPVLADIKMGVFPRRSTAATNKIFKPLADELSKALGEPVQLIIAKNFKYFWRGIEDNEYDLVHYNQYHYLLSHKNFGYKVIAVNEEFGNNKISGSLIVRKDSGIKKVADLKGKTILFGGSEKAMGSYIAPISILKKAGLLAGRDYTVSFSKNPPGAAIGVFNNAANAAGVGNVILKVKGVQKKIDVSQMKVLAESKPFIQLPWAVNANMPTAKANKIQSFMTSLKGNNDALLKSTRVTNFLKASDKDFNSVREIVKFSIDERL